MISWSAWRRCLFMLPLVCGSELTAQVPGTARADSLRNAGKFREAVTVLDVRVRNYPDDVAARAMLGETYYWLGDYSAAVRTFRAVLQRDSTNTLARRELAEIRAATTPWASFEARRVTDTQPITRAQLDLRGGGYITPLWSMGAVVQPSRATAGDTALDRIDARAAMHGFNATARMDFDFDIGLVMASSNLPTSRESTTNAVGRARVGLHVAKGLVWSVAIERGQYTATLASLVRPLMTTATRTTLQLDRRGWLGEIAAQQESYPDRNTISTVYGWGLAPVIKSAHALVQVGYAASYQDSDSSHYTTANRYDPYFTPQNDRQHGVAASLMSWNGTGARVQINGSYGISAHRDTPTFSYHPYDIRATGSIPLATRHTLSVSAERVRTAFYSQTILTALLALRFAPRPAT